MLKALLFTSAIGIGLALGGGAGWMLRPETRSSDPSMQSRAPAAAPAPTVFVDMDRQFVVPVLDDGRVTSMVVVSISLEVDEAAQDAAATREPLLRDRFLRAMLDHANARGFDGAFTSNGSVDQLKRRLLAEARIELGDSARDILIQNINRQDV